MTPEEALQKAKDDARGGRVMAIGRSEVGKTTLMASLGLLPSVIKTEAVQFTGHCIDTPGEFLETPLHRHIFMTLSTKAALIMLVVDPTRYAGFPPRMAQVMRAPTIGVITKSDLGAPQTMERARKNLLIAGARKVYRISSMTGEGLDELKNVMLRYGIEFPADSKPAPVLAKPVTGLEPESKTSQL